MHLKELIELLQRTSEVHQDADAVQSYTAEGKLSSRIGVHIKGKRIIIQGEHV